MVSTQRRSRSPRSDVARRSLIARMPVRGVRTSCAKVASAVLDHAGSSRLARRLPDGLARLDGRRTRFTLFRPLLFQPPLAAPWTRTRCHDSPKPGSPQHGTPKSMESRRSVICSRTECGNLRKLQARPIRRRISIRVTPASLNSRRPVASVDFDNFCPSRIANQAVVPIGRLRQAEQHLQQPMDTGRPEQVLPAHHLGDALQGIVDRDGKVIAGGRLLSRDNDIAPGGVIGGDRPRFRRSDLPRARSSSIGRRGRRPPPYRAAARKARRIASIDPVHSPKVRAPCPDKAVRRRDRVATAPLPPARRSDGPPPRGFRRKHRPAASP